jgi:hypothetical protein
VNVKLHWLFYQNQHTFKFGKRSRKMKTKMLNLVPLVSVILIRVFFDPVTDTINRWIELISSWWAAIQGLFLIALLMASGVALFIIAIIVIVKVIIGWRAGIGAWAILLSVLGVMGIGLVFLIIGAIPAALLAQRGVIQQWTADLMAAITGQ